MLYAQDKLNDYRVARGTSGYQLSSLYPTIEKKHHAQYVSSLNKAAKDKKIKNLALTGHYGSGKSSILEWFVNHKKRKVVRISFSTLGANIEKYITTDEGDPKAKRLGVLSNLIQKEIVKHILFNDKPSSLPNSRYYRAAKPNKLSVLLLSLWIAAILIFIGYATDFSKFVESLSLRIDWPTPYIWATLGFFAWLSVAIFLFIGGSKIKLNKISGGPLSLSLDGEKSYFDEYLDEIIYYFQATGRRIVIIEDIDRFNTLYIFENLRQLNTILNNSKQIRGRVLFVYAIKDSVFVQNTFDDSTEDKKEAKESGVVTEIAEELAEAQESDSQSRVTNRTKFFDLIVPVVPFITISSSKMFIKSMLEKISHKVSDGLIETVAKHINDMRLIKNMYNEFVVFKDKVVTDSGINSLNDNSLFALVAYKNTYLADFENIKDGTSVLDDIYTERRKFIGERSREVTKRITELNERLSSNINIEKTAKGFGETLLKYVDDVAAQTGVSVISYNFDGKAYSADQIKTLPFWEELSKADLTTVFTVAHNPTNYNVARQQTLTKAFIVNELIGSVDLVALKATEEQDIKGKIEVLKVEQKELLHIDIADLMLIYEEKFLPIVEKVLNDGRLFDRRLALDLLKSGYIDSNYILYTSVYHKDGMSPNAANFAIQFIQREDQQDIYYDLDSKDIKQLLQENVSYVDERSMYNISIVDYLLTHQIDRKLRIILANIGAGKYNAEEFINEYVSNTKYLSKFIARITREWDGVFEFIVKSNLIKAKQRNALISTALVNTDVRKEYIVDDDITQYIVENAFEISTLKSSTEQSKVDSIKHVLKKLNARFESMDSLSAKVKRAVIDNGLYVINADNLKQILGSEDYSLDAIKKSQEELYANILSHFEEYITMLDGLKVKQFSIKGDQGFEEIINDVSSNAKDSLGELLDHADLASCLVDELYSLKASAWTQAIQHVIISNTFGNALDYYEYGHSENEVVDAILGTYLNAVGTLVLDSSMDTRDAEAKDMLIIAILNSPNVQVDVKVNIVKDCYNGTFVDVAEITPQEGELYGLLLKNGSIEDTAENLNEISKLSWSTRKHYIGNSSELLTYINGVEWKADDIDGIASAENLDELKKRVIMDIDTYKGMLSYSAADDFVEYAYSQQMQLTPEVLAILFSKAGSLRDEATIGLVNLMPVSTTAAGIVQPLAKLGEPYISLTQSLHKPKLANETYNQTLIERIEKLGMVSKKQTINEDQQIQVNMKRDW